MLDQSLILLALDGQPADGGDPTGRIVRISVILIVSLILGCVAVLQVKRRLQRHDLATGAGAGFTLADLRAMRKSGQISEEEFERAKGKIVESMKRATERDSGIPRQQGDMTVAVKSLRSAQDARDSHAPDNGDDTPGSST